MLPAGDEPAEVAEFAERAAALAACIQEAQSQGPELSDDRRRAAAEATCFARLDAVRNAQQPPGGVVDAVPGEGAIVSPGLSGKRWSQLYATLAASEAFLILVFCSLILLLTGVVLSFVRGIASRPLGRFAAFSVACAQEVAPFMGMLGTVYSFAIVAAGSSDAGLTLLFKQGFKAAVTTTLLGGMVYILAVLRSAYGESADEARAV